jgi:Zn-dependent M28 family amino/carboxypeptidase
MRKILVWAVAGLPVVLADAHAQTSPFVDEKVERALVNELSGDLAFETLRITTQWHKPSGSEGFYAVAREVEARAKAAGLQDVRWIEQAAVNPNWTGKRSEAWLIAGSGPDAVETRIASMAEVATSLADNSRPASVTAELVDVGAGETPADYAGKDVRGKIVLAFGTVATVMEQAVWKRGAAGILSWNSSRLNPLADSADQIAWVSVPDKDGPNGEKTTFAIVLSAREGKSLSDRMRGESPRRWGAGATKTGEPLRLRVLVESVVLPERRTAMVEARIPGTDPSLPEIVLTAHLQEEKFSANDDQSGVASILEIGRALTKLIADGKLPRPRRSIRFWWADEIYSEYRYFADHPGEEKKFLANINQDMVGARQSIGHRTQFMARTPWAVPSFLSDVQQSILDAVVAGNNAYLAAWQAQTPAPGQAFSKPIFARLGTREPFHAQAVPYFDSTDHLVFNDPWVRVPGTSLTNWPDEYIHSSVDDLWQIDPTQLKRNAFVVAATTWWLANAGPDDAAFLASFVAARGAERLARDLATGEAWIRDGKGSDDDRRRAAVDLLAVGKLVEAAAVESARAIGPSPDSAVAASVAAVRSAASALAARLPARPTAEDPALTRLSAKTPRFAVTTLDAWMALEEKVKDKRDAEKRAARDAKERDTQQAAKKPTTKSGKAAPAAVAEPEPVALSPLMGTAAMSWIDGKTSAAEIARRVCAEALSAGWWYYGETTPALVEQFLEKQVKDGLIAW